MNVFSLSFLMAFSLVYAILPPIIHIGLKKGLVANATEDRHVHKNATPYVGGIAIFFGSLFAILLLTPLGEWKTVQYIISALVLVFLIGIKDDITELSPRSKLVGLIVSILIVVTKGEVRLDGMYGLGHLDGNFPYWASILITSFTLLVITNAYNLIDGINGLSGTLGCIITLAFGVWFYEVGLAHLSIMALATAGSLLAFLRFNMVRARTFMGDTGTLVVGLLIAVFTVEFIDSCTMMALPSRYRFANPVAIAVALLIVPLFDTIRVFSTRVYRKGSPFKPDRRHIHHLLIDSGYSHVAATAILAFVTITTFTLTVAIDDLVDLHLILALQIGSALVMTYWLHRYARRRKTVTGRRTEEAQEDRVDELVSGTVTRMNLLAVFLGGGLGALARHLVGTLIGTPELLRGSFPWSTFVANLLACLVLALGVRAVARGQLSETAQLLLLTGFCGGFSTFSTYALEIMLLGKAGHWGIALAYALGSLLAGAGVLALVVAE